MSGSGFHRQENPTTNITFELDDSEISLLGNGDDYKKINPFLTLELNKRLHQNKTKSMYNIDRRDNRFRFVVIDTQPSGRYCIQPQDLNIDSNYNHLREYYSEKYRGLPSYWWNEDNSLFTDDYDEDFKKMEEINESEVK